jgi:hypothetical protein
MSLFYRFEVSLIFYLFSNIDIIDLSNDFIINVIITRFINDVAFLAIKNIIKEYNEIFKSLA